MALEQRKLGKEITVSSLCLGTMTFGEQNSEAEAYAQLDRALDHGINFVDTAEMYPIPPNPETYTATEAILGRWMALRNARSKIVLATKATGPSRGMFWIRGGVARFNATQLRVAVEGSLGRLKTDRIDLYQLHWPERTTNNFGSLHYVPSAQEETDLTAMEETVVALHQLKQEGKIREWGLSNETAWGTMRFLDAARLAGVSGPVSIQNPYSLLNRTFEGSLAEVAHREQIGLLAYSPLAFGYLTGKYDGPWPAMGRLSLFRHYKRYVNERSTAAMKEYVKLARHSGWDPAQMALAFVHGRPFTTSVILGATSLEQLDSDLLCTERPLPKDMVREIEGIFLRYPNPCP